MTVQPLNPARLAAAKRGFAVRNVPDAAFGWFNPAAGTPVAGDLMLARVISIGHHKQIELPSSRKAMLFPGDEVIVAGGARYAPDQFEADVPGDLGPCDLAAAGGIAGVVVSRHAATGQPTRLQPLGLFADADGRTLNLRDFALPARLAVTDNPVIAVVGGSMNAGKTTAAASLVRGLTLAGYRVGAAKLTGTGAGNDYWHMKDAGAVRVLDFADAGLATTYKAPMPALESAALALTSGLWEAGAEVAVVEIADGLFQQETAALVASRTLRQLVSGYVYAGESAASAALGVQWLRRQGCLVLGVSGLLSASPLAAREAETATGLACATRDLLATPAHAAAWMARLAPGRAAAA